jgi:hypothetical protein
MFKKKKNMTPVVDDQPQKSQKLSHYFNNLLGSTVTLSAVIAYLTSDTILKVVEGHLKGHEVQFQQIIEIVWWKNQNHRDTESFEF